MDSDIRSLKEADLGEADRVARLSFGTFLGLADPMSFFGDADYIRTRFRADPTLSLAAEEDGNFVGSNFIANWAVWEYLGHLQSTPTFGTRALQNVC